jgi:phage gp36-like protein
MTSPLYATTSDLRLVLDGTDAGSGTAAQLSDAQLTLAIEAASTRVSTYTGTVWDSSTPAAVPPDLLKDLTLDLAAWWATTYYSKHKEMSAQHPVVLRYAEAMKVLEAIRSGEIRPDVQPPGGVGAETGHINNPLPPIFTGDDSNTVFDPSTGTIEADTPPDQWNSRLFAGWLSGVEAP